MFYNLRQKLWVMWWSCSPSPHLPFEALSHDCRMPLWPISTHVLLTGFCFLRPQWYRRAREPDANAEWTARRSVCVCVLPCSGNTSAASVTLNTFSLRHRARLEMKTSVVRRLRCAVQLPSQRVTAEPSVHSLLFAVWNNQKSSTRLALGALMCD